MTDSDHYSPFDAPEQLAGKEPADWTKTEARTYFDWLVEQVEPRSSRLLAWLGLDDRPDHAGVLREVGAAAVERLRSPAFSGPRKTVPVVLTRSTHRVGEDCASSKERSRESDLRGGWPKSKALAEKSLMRARAASFRIEPPAMAMASAATIPAVGPGEREGFNNPNHAAQRYS